MLDNLRAYLRRYIPDTARDRWHRVLLVAVGGLLANGLLDNNHAELWTRLGVASISLLFAWLYATDKVRAYLYGLVVTIGGPLYAWGITHNVHWAVVVATMAQALGMGTAVRKAPREQLNGPDDVAAETPLPAE